MKKLIAQILVCYLGVSSGLLIAQPLSVYNKATSTLYALTLDEAKWAMNRSPVTITSFPAVRSKGGKHDFFSEGDYWWPDPQHPEGPYIQRDGMTNPENFTSHRKAMIEFSKIMGALASAYRITGNEQYAQHAFQHAHSWFIDTATRMNPHMLYAQAIQGRFSGRGIGIIDMIQFIEVAQALFVLEKSLSANAKDYVLYRKWFEDYLNWVTHHPYGIDEKNALNNHGTCWTLQVAAFARFTNDQSLMDTCRFRYRTKHLPEQMAIDGSFPKELSRTKPYGYSLFNLDAMAMICQILSDNKNDLWEFETPDKKSIQKGISFLIPFISNKKRWPYARDVMYWENWPIAQPFLLFGANAYDNSEYFNVWKTLDHQPTVDEVVRNLPVRHPLIWFNTHR